MKVIILGKSTFENQLTIEHVQVYLKKNKIKLKEIIATEKNEDEIAFVLSDVLDIPISYFPIEWENMEGCSTPKINRWGKTYNPMAGYNRNQKMVKEADAMVIFWDDLSDHTFLISEMKKTGKDVLFAKPNVEYVF